MKISFLRGLLAGADVALIADPDRVDRLYRRHRPRVMAAMTLGVVFMYMGRLAIGFVKDPMIEAGIFDAQEFGYIGSAFFYVYAIGRLTNGFFADHVNIRRFFALGLLGSALLNASMGVAVSVALAVALWGVNGWFQSVTAPSGAVGIVSWFSGSERGRIYGVWSTASSIGQACSSVVLAAAVAALGWRFGYFVPAVVCLAGAAFVYAFAQDRPTTLGLPPVGTWKNESRIETRDVQARGVAAAQKSILLMPAVWVLALSSAAIYVPRSAFTSWGPLYLQEIRGLPLPTVGGLIGIASVAGVAGSMFYGLGSDKLFGARRPPANLLFGVIEVAGLALVFLGPDTHPILVAGVVIFGFGMAGLVTSLGGLFAVDICPKHAAGAAMGFVGVFSYLGAGIQDNVSGYLIQRSSRIVDGQTIHDFGPAIQFWIASSIVSMILALTLWRVKVRD